MFTKLFLSSSPVQLYGSIIVKSNAKNIFLVNFTLFLITSSPKIFLTPLDAFPPMIVYNLEVNRFFNWSDSFSKLESIFFNSSLSVNLDFLSFIVFEYNDLPITTPWSAGLVFKDASFTSPAFSPNIARSNFSSGVGSDSPFGVIFPIRISPVFACEPTLIIPYSSKSLVAFSEIFGISAVNSSAPLLVSLTFTKCSAICSDVNKSSLTTLSDKTIASSKLYPFHGINATFKFLPIANSPFSVA